MEKLDSPGRSEQFSVLLMLILLCSYDCYTLRAPLLYSLPPSISQKPFTVDHSLHQALAGAPLCKAGGLWFSGPRKKGQEEKGVAQTEVGCGGERVPLHSFFYITTGSDFFFSSSSMSGHQGLSSVGEGSSSLGKQGQITWRD